VRTGVVLFLLFTVVPAVETWLLVTIGSRVGALPTVCYLVAMGVLGAQLGKRAGIRVLGGVFKDLWRGVPPADRLVEAALVLVGSVLLVTPGVLSDMVGILLFLGPVRRWLAPHARRAASAYLQVRGVRVGPAGPGPGMSAGFTLGGAPPSPASDDLAPPPSPRPRAFDHPTR
jgi:UPF0716 protein FxsA